MFMKSRILIGFLFLTSGLFFLSGCLETADPVTPEAALANQISATDKLQLQADLKIIDDTLARRNIVAQKETNGVRYVIQTLGTGAKPTLSSVIKAKYVGKIFSSGAIFAPADTLEIELYNLIIGWQTTMPLMPAGTKLTLYIPSGYGYGSRDVTDTSGKVIIPKNSNILFEIELLEVK